MASLSIEKQLLNNPENSKALRDSLLNLDNQLHQLKSDLRQNSPAYSRFYQHQPFLDPDDIIKHLSQKQQLCEFHLTKDSIFVFSISHGKGLRLITLPKPPELKKEIEKLMAGDPPAIDLYGALLAPVIEEGITRLQFIPDGELWRLPFQSLKTPNGKYLIEEYAISYAYAAPVLLNQNQKRSVRKTRKKYLGYGIDYEGLIQGNIGGSRVSAPRGLQNLKPLPFATSEVQQAAEIMGGEALLNSSVTKSSFLDQAPSADIVHLSMHGLLSMDPLANALVFHTEDSNEYVPFSMAEMLTQRMDPELTVLSSCHTGDGPIILAEGMFSMGSAFTIGGSKSTITSNWEANDAITHDIMIAFYEQLNDGASKDVALQQAIIKHIERGSPAEGHPSNWANLSLNGSTFPLQHHQVNYWRWALSLTPIFLLLIYWFWHSNRAW